MRHCASVAAQTAVAKHWGARLPLDPKDAGAWLYLGMAYRNLSFDDKVVPPLQSAFRLNAQDYCVHEYPGMVLERSDQPERAISEHAEAVRLNDRHDHSAAEPHVEYGGLLYKLDCLEGSESQLWAAVKLDPTLWRSHFELGKVMNLLVAGDLTDDDAALVNRLLGQICLQAGREEEGRLVLARADQPQP